MTVYVDDMAIPHGRMRMCHMLADSTGELLAMADAIGVARRHLHDGHFNICQAKRAQAIAAGAVAVSRRDAVRIRRRNRFGAPA